MLDSDSVEVEQQAPPVISSRTEYDALPNLNWSRLRLLDKSPAHFKLGFGDDSSAFRLGTAAHCAVLEPAKFAATYVVYPGKVRRGKEWEKFEFEATAAGKAVLSRSEYGEAEEICAAVRKHPRASALLSGGDPEVSMVWTLEGGGLSFDCKGMADYISPTAIIDLKTTQCASPRAFGTSCLKYGYLGQAAWYSDGCERLTGIRRPFYFVAVESARPYLVTVFKLTDAQLERGRDQYRALLGKLDYCQRANFWGGYSESEESEIEIPNWASKQEE